MSQTLFDVLSAADYLGVTAAHVRKLVRTSQLEASLIARKYRFTESQLQTFISSRTGMKRKAA
jgi:excisionase family DNA binding protein